MSKSRELCLIAFRIEPFRVNYKNVEPGKNSHSPFVGVNIKALLLGIIFREESGVNATLLIKECMERIQIKQPKSRTHIIN